MVYGSALAVQSYSGNHRRVCNTDFDTGTADTQNFAVLPPLLYSITGGLRKAFPRLRITSADLVDLAVLQTETECMPRTGFVFQAKYDSLDRVMLRIVYDPNSLKLNACCSYTGCTKCVPDNGSRAIIRMGIGESDTVAVAKKTMYVVPEELYSASIDILSSVLKKGRINVLLRQRQARNRERRLRNTMCSQSDFLRLLRDAPSVLGDKPVIVPVPSSGMPWRILNIVQQASASAYR
ncbi:MAG: hypothetical protein V1659_01170 [Candidatus Woesearchaeota archaeon]